MTCRVRVVQTGDDTATFKVNHLRVRPALITLRVIHADDSSILDGEIFRFGIFWVERRNASIVENQVGSGF